MRLSATMVTWNEATTIDLALKSIVGFADEVILVDNGSTDKTVEIARQCFKRWNLNGKIYIKNGLLLADARLFATKKSTGDWICVLDGDHVLNTQRIKPARRLRFVFTKSLRRLAKNSKPRCYRFRYLQLYGDFYHAFRKYPVAPPHVFLFPNIPEKIYRATRRLNLPEFGFGEIKRQEIIGANLTGLKPALRMYVRNYFHAWQRDKRYKNALEYLTKTTKMNMGTLERKARRWMIKRMRSQCVRFNDVFPSGMRILPIIVQEELKNPRYELIYRNKKIVGRSPDLMEGL